MLEKIVYRAYIARVDLKYFDRSAVLLTPFKKLVCEGLLLCGGHTGEWKDGERGRLGLGKDEQSRGLAIRPEA